MARYTGPRVRVSRRIGFNVFENKKGDKALQDRPYPPGENGRKRSRETDYGTQLKEKQKVRYMYGVLEKQFRNYYKEASRMNGITGENLLIISAYERAIRVFINKEEKLVIDNNRIVILNIEKDFKVNLNLKNDVCFKGKIDRVD